ncbi:molybdenum cofactor biosynthesis protein MoaC, partial [Enterococcus faecalis]|nr:molybdenum cofactor biosynthesis protein MoaC [Enterococcus faecalis]
PVGTKMKIGDSEWGVTQIGKECHKSCQMYARVGDCIMPRELIFAVVETEGHIKKGDQLDVV